MNKSLIASLTVTLSLLTSTAFAGPMASCRTLKVNRSVDSYTTPLSSTSGFSTLPVRVSLETLSCSGLNGMNEVQGYSIHVPSDISLDTAWQQVNITALNAKNEIIYQEGHHFLGSLKAGPKTISSVILSPQTKTVILRFAHFKQLVIQL